MHAISGKMIWVPLFLAIFIFLGIKYKRKFLVIFLLILFGFALTELSAVYLFKNTFQRLRPCHEPALEGLVHVYGKSSSLYGFVSSHAANCFYLAVACGLFVRKRWFLACLLCWAAIISYSRIYLGMHYPGDVIGGAALGALMGGSMVKLYEIYRSRFEIPVPGAGCRAFKPDKGGCAGAEPKNDQSGSTTLSSALPEHILSALPQ